MPSNECDLHSLRISSADLPERDRIEEFREIFGRTILKIEIDPLQGHAHDHVALALGGTRDALDVAKGRGARAARLRAITSDIRTNAGSRDLSVSVLAERHGVSPRHVQMLFEREGTTFSEYVLARRLERAHSLLTDSHCLHLKVSEIAYNAGFSDLSYFNRAFRLRFGDTPSGVRPDRRALR